jgi:hypothetical protein
MVTMPTEAELKAKIIEDNQVVDASVTSNPKGSPRKEVRRGSIKKLGDGLGSGLMEWSEEGDGVGDKIYGKGKKKGDKNGAEELSLTLPSLTLTDSSIKGKNPKLFKQIAQVAASPGPGVLLKLLSLSH